MNNTNDQTIKNLLDNIILTQKIYQKASSAIHDSFLTNHFLRTSEKKSLAKKELAKITLVNLSDHDISILKKIKSLPGDMLLVFDDLVLERNERAILSFCIQREKDLIKSYAEVIQETQNSFLIEVLRRHRNECRKVLDKLEELYTGYDYPNFNS